MTGLGRVPDLDIYWIWNCDSGWRATTRDQQVLTSNCFAMMLVNTGNLSPESTAWIRNSLINACVSSCVEVWQNSQRLANRCDYFDIQERRSQVMYQLQRDITPQFDRKSLCQMPWKEMPRNRGIKTGRWSVRFLCGSQHHGPNFHSDANLREISGVWQRSLCMLCRSWKSIWTSSSG